MLGLSSGRTCLDVDVEPRFGLRLLTGVPLEI